MNDNTRQNFINPPSEFSPMPFWFWNDKLDEDKIISQINEMNDKGVNGFVIHPRIGLPREIQYMSGEFLYYVKCAVQEADRLGMKVILYDEGMYPSGSAHGMVVENNPEFATRGIRIEESLNKKALLENNEKVVCTLIAKKSDNGALEENSISIYGDEKLPEKYAFLHIIEGFTYGTIRGIHIGEDDWENPPRSADILNTDSVAEFIRLTHYKYYDTLAEYFGKTIIGIFVDEPSVLGRAGDPRMKPWTKGFEKKLCEAQFSLDDLPGLWYEVGDRTSDIRKKYSNIVENQLIESFYKPIYNWCEQHNISLIGHPAASGDIGLLNYFHIPGQDLIFRRIAPENETSLVGVDSTQAKCSSDAARHSNRRRNVNECFACGGKNGVEWSFNADDMKWTMDWLFSRGVNMLIPHAFFYSLDGPLRFGERPPDVGINNIWWKHYNSFSNYIKRMCFMLTDSKNVTPVAILCESDFLPYESAKVLYENQIEFNYLEENLLKNEKCCVQNGKIHIASQSYSYLIVEKPKLITKKISEFAHCGGKVIVLNSEGVVTNDEYTYVAEVEEIPTLLEKDLSITPSCKDLRVSHIVKNDEHYYLLVNEGEQCIKGTVFVVADKEIHVLDPWSGEIREFKNEQITLNRRESVILCVGKNPSVQRKILFGEVYGDVKEEIELNQWFVNSKKFELGSWTQIENMEKYCGTVTYSTTFNASLVNTKKVVLDMGNVGEQAEVYLNGKYLGFRLWAPYVMEITENLKEGNNDLSIAVTNSLANKYTDKLQPSGILEKVVLKIF